MKFYLICFCLILYLSDITIMYVVLIPLLLYIQEKGRRSLQCTVPKHSSATSICPADRSILTGVDLDV